MIEMNEQQAIEERAKYVAAFNDTMIKIWQEQITLLGVIDTGQLLRSPVGVRATADGKVSEVHLSQAFLEYGLWQDYGTGKEVPRGNRRTKQAQSQTGLSFALQEGGRPKANSGDLGKPKVRKARHWFSRKYYMSVMNIKEFMADSLGRQFQGILADLDGKKLGRKL